MMGSERDMEDVSDSGIMEVKVAKEEEECVEPKQEARSSQGGHWEKVL